MSERRCEKCDAPIPNGLNGCPTCFRRPHTPEGDPFVCLNFGMEKPPSCDSELAAIREHLSTGAKFLDADDGRALLRMVDELTKEQAQYIEDIAYMAANEASLQLERDDLRAKLETATIANEMYQQTTSEQLAMIDDLRAKLADVHPDSPEDDATDAAHPAWWRGQDSGTLQTAIRLLDIARNGRNGGSFGGEVEAAAKEIETIRGKWTAAEACILAKEHTIKVLRAKLATAQRTIQLRGERIGELAAKLAATADDVTWMGVVWQSEKAELEAKLADAHAEAEATSAATSEEIARLVEFGREAEAREDRWKQSYAILKDKLAASRRLFEAGEADYRKLEAKLAEAEKTATVFREANERSLRSIVEQRERAEAAEARVRELENR